MVLKPVIMNYGTTEINFEKESESDRDFYTIKQYTIYLLKSYNPPMKKIYKSKKSVTLQNNNYMTSSNHKPDPPLNALPPSNISPQ